MIENFLHLIVFLALSYTLHFCVLFKYMEMIPLFTQLIGGSINVQRMISAKCALHLGCMTPLSTLQCCA
jgi:hypothetical protein